MKKFIFILMTTFVFSSPVFAGIGGTSGGTSHTDQNSVQDGDWVIAKINLAGESGVENLTIRYRFRSPSQPSDKKPTLCRSPFGEEHYRPCD